MASQIAALAFMDVGRRLVRLRFPLLDRGLAGEVVLAERRLPPIFGLVVFLRRLVGGERRLLLVDLRLIDVALDAKQLRALLDHGAVDVIDRGEKALHARDEVDGGERGGIPGQLEVLGHRLLERLRHLHLGWRRRDIGVPRTVAACERDGGCAEARGASSPRADSSPRPKVTHQYQTPIPAIVTTQSMGDADAALPDCLDPAP